MVEKYDMEKSNVVAMPLDPADQLEKSELTAEEEGHMKNLPYRQLLGSLSYLALATRCDIAYAVARLAQYAAKPNLSHWKLLKRVLRYVKGTAELGILYQKTGEPLHLYSDASFASDPNDRRSFSGTVAFLAGY